MTNKKLVLFPSQLTRYLSDSHEHAFSERLIVQINSIIIPDTVTPVIHTPGALVLCRWQHWAISWQAEVPTDFIVDSPTRNVPCNNSSRIFFSQITRIIMYQLWDRFIHHHNNSFMEIGQLCLFRHHFSCPSLSLRFFLELFCLLVFIVIIIINIIIIIIIIIINYPWKSITCHSLHMVCSVFLYTCILSMTKVIFN